MAEKLEKNITKQQQSNVEVPFSGGQEVQSELLTSERAFGEVLDSKLKEEIAAQSLILSALSGGGNNIIQKQNVQLQDQISVPSVVTIPQSQTLTQTSTIPLGAVQTEDTENTSDDLAFDVSQAIGVEMIAVQQQQNITYDARQQQHPTQNKENETHFISDDEALLNSALTAAANSSVVVVKEDESRDAAIHFESPQNGEEDMSQEIQLSQAGVLTIDENGINAGIAANEIELPTENNQQYPKLFAATTAQEAHEIIKKYAEETMSTFVSMRKMKQYGITGKTCFNYC